MPTNAGQLKAQRRLEQEEAIAAESALLDPDNTEEAVMAGLHAIERGEYTEINTEADLREFFDDIVRRGKKRLAAKRRAAGG